jgi:hypothetical protein
MLWVVMVGCSHPLAERSAQYATLGEKTAAALQPVSSLAHLTCLQTARTEFLQQRLLRLKAESFGKELDAGYYIDEVHWLGKSLATSGSVTWAAYCKEIDQSTAAFRTGLAALSAYAASVGALSDLGRDYHPDWGALFASAEAIEGSLSNPDNRWVKLVPPLTSPIKQLSHLWLSYQAEQSLAATLVEAQPSLDPLILAMQQYLNAVSEQLSTLNTRQSSLLESFEILAGFGGQREATRSIKCHPANAATTSAPGSDPDDLLAKLCERSSLQQRQIDSLVLLLLDNNAQTLTAATERDIATVEHYKETLEVLSMVHAQLAKTAQATNSSDLERTSQDLARLSQVIDQPEREPWTSSRH